MDLEAGGVLCWGYGQAGLGKTTETDTIAAGGTASCASIAGEGLCWGVIPVGLERADVVDLGDRTTCAIQGDSLYCWGDNGLEQVGDGTKVNRLVPTEISLP